MQVERPLRSTVWRGMSAMRIMQAASQLWNAEYLTGGIPDQALIQDRFLHFAGLYPGRPCLLYQYRTTTYGEVELRSAAVARGLLAAGVRPGEVVAVIAERCDALVWTILGVLRAGAAFAILDRTYPRARMASLLEIVAPAAIVFCGSGQEYEPAFSGSVPHFDQDRLQAAGGASGEFPGHTRKSSDVAYYLFTSGSTGKPKCVACHHAPLVNFFRWHSTTFGLNDSDCFSLLSGVSHDPVLRDIFTPLSLGATLAIPRQDLFTEVGGLHHFLWERRVTIVHLTPPMGQLLLSARAQAPPLSDVRHFFWGGDRLLASTVAAMRNLAPRAEHTNFYGCTETPQAAAYYRVPSQLDEQNISIGQGVRGFRIRIVGDSRYPLAGRALGEIAVESEFLSLGYVERGRIFDHSTRRGDGYGIRVYYTGDLGYQLPDGNIQIVGRADDQLKIRGHRIDLSEIQTLLSLHPDLAAAAAIAFGPDKRRQICAFAVPKPGATVIAAQLEEYVASNAPSYMAPSSYIVLDSGLPLLANGKIDRCALMRLAEDRSSARGGGVSPPPDTVLGPWIVEWSKLFQRNDISPESTFINLGGDSLTFVDAYLALEQRLGCVPDGWQTMTLRRLSQYAKIKLPFVAFLDSAIVLRAFAIAMVVALHGEYLPLGFGATAALFIVSGYLYAESMRDALFDPRRSRKLLNPLENLLAPTIIFTFIGATAVYVQYGRFFPASFLLLADTVPSAQIYDYPDAYFAWFLDALLKIILVAWGVQSLLARCKPDPRLQFLFLTAAASAFCLLRLGVPPLARYLFAGVYSHDLDTCATNFSFLVNLGLFYMGMCLPRIKTNISKAAFLFLAAIYAGLCVRDFGLNSSVYFFSSAAVILLLPRIYVPRLARRAVYETASASMYIYLANLWVLFFWDLAMRGLGTKNGVVNWAGFPVCILFGIALAKAIKFLRQKISRWEQEKDGGSLLRESEARAMEVE